MYLYRQGSQGRGIVGSGWVVRGAFEAPHWNDARGGVANYVEVAFDALLDPQDDVLLLPSVLDGPVLGGVNWGTQTSGIRLGDEATRRLEALWVGWLATQQTDGDGFLLVMEEYAEERVVFSSSVRDALYTVTRVDEGGADVARLSASEPARVTASGFARAVRRVLQNGGRFPAVQLDGTAAVRNAYYQSPELALDPSGDVVALVTPEDAADLLVAHLDALRVDRSGGTPKPYQPAVLACVLEAIETGELTENRIPYGWLEPRFLEFLGARGVDATSTQAAYGYFYLSRKPFWLLAYASPSAEAVAALDPPSRAKLERTVTHARLGAPFWASLQDAELRPRVREALEAWWSSGDGVAIDRELLARVVERTIRPAIVEGGRLAEGAPEGYHHHKVLPTTVPLLSRESIEADPVGAVDATLKAHVNLLSQYELMYATTFFGETPESVDAVREHVLDLLYGEDGLAERVDRFTAWAQMDDRADGASRSVNATVASYLLAASQPHRYAFCKPSVYTPAAKALLGEAVGPGSPGERVAHTTAFYRAALSLLRDAHGLPFEDLMHVHIAFYVVKQDDLFPGWKELQEIQASGELAETFEAILADYDRARREESFGKTDEDGTVRPMWALFERAVELLRASDAVQRHPHVRVSFSVGAGNWARVPWIALMDERETTSTQRGTYVVYLFREDATGVYLTLNQGVTDTIKEHGRREGHPILADQARRLREATPQLEGAGFTLDGDVDLRASGGLGADYEVSTVAYTLYEEGHVPHDGRLLDDLGAVLDAYASARVLYPTGDGGGGTVKEGALAPPLSAVFESRGEAEWAFGLLRRTLGLLGVSGPGAPRVAMTLPRAHKGTVLRLNFGPWLVLDFRGAGPLVAPGVGVTLPVRSGEGFPTAEQVEEPFTSSDAEDPMAIYRIDTAALRDMGDAEGAVFEEAMGRIRRRFERWQGSAYRAAHQPQLEAAVFDDEVLAALLDGELALAPPGPLGDPSVRDDITSTPAGRLLLDRKNVILYGPPGTGKTRASLELARLWKRWQGEDTVEQVTFHPTFAYEDFIEGFRPDPDGGGFTLRDGVFVQLCDRARDDEDRQYLLLVDEINRGDVSRILGELVTGLEKDKRGAHAARRLPYSQRPFWVPPNLHILGTMNTADRSISLMDVAVRRRFAFIETPPDPSVLATAEGHVHNVEGIALDALLQALNGRLHGVGVDRDRAIGHSYLLLREVPGDALDRLADRLRYDVIPMVEEYCYADRQLMRDVLGALVREDGRADDEVFGDRARLVRALRQIAGVSMDDATDVEEDA